MPNRLPPSFSDMDSQQLEPIWQVDVGGQVYPASFNDLGTWIGEGALLPQDKVRKGNLRWIEAQKVPGLVPFFNAKESGRPMPITVTETEPAQEAEPLGFPVEEPSLLIHTPQTI